MCDIEHDWVSAHFWRTATAGLAQNRYFDDAAFVSYLQYLQYWKRPEYARFIMCVLAHPILSVHCTKLPDTKLTPVYLPLAAILTAYISWICCKARTSELPSQ